MILDDYIADYDIEIVDDDENDDGDSTCHEEKNTSGGFDSDDFDYDAIDYTEYYEDDDSSDKDIQAISVSPTSVVKTLNGILSSRKRSKRKRVRWFSQVRVQDIRHLEDMSEVEKDAQWISPIETQKSKIQREITLLKMMSKEAIDENDLEFCTRGLEFRTTAGRKDRAENKVIAWSAVLNEQELQREEGFNEPNFIAMALMDVSYKCGEEAYIRGEKDALCIQSYLKDVAMCPWK